MISYRLKLLMFIRRLYLVFNVVKLTTIFEDLIPGSHTPLLLDSIVINREKRWEVEYILDNC